MTVALCVLAFMVGIVIGFVVCAALVKDDEPSETEQARRREVDYWTVGRGTGVGETGGRLDR